MVNKTEATRNAACNAVVDRVDDGTNSPYGVLGLYTSDSTEITALRLSNPAFRDATDGTAIVNFIYDATAFVDGTAALFWFNNRDGSNVFGGTVSGPGGGGDMQLSNISIPKDSTVSITPGYYSVP